MDTRLPTAGLDLQTELTTTQFRVPAGAGATFAVSNNIATITTNAAHGWTLSPAAGVMANYFMTFSTGMTGVTGTGVLLGNIFRILSIPSATTFTIYTTVTAANVTTTTFDPIFFPPFTAGIGSAFLNGPSQLIATAGTYPLPNLGGAMFNALLGANVNLQYNPDQTAQILDGTTGNTPAVAPTWRTLLAVSTSGQVWGAPPWTALYGAGGAGTTRVSVVA